MEPERIAKFIWRVEPERIAKFIWRVEPARIAKFIWRVEPERIAKFIWRVEPADSGIRQINLAVRVTAHYRAGEYRAVLKNIH